MPTYEYECEKCGLVFEEYQNITAPPLTLCRTPGCKGTVKRLFSAGAGFLFKGNGFYSTDYRSESYKSKAKAEGTPPPATGDSKGKPPASSTGAAAKP